MTKCFLFEHCHDCPFHEPYEDTQFGRCIPLDKILESDNPYDQDGCPVPEQKVD